MPRFIIISFIFFIPLYSISQTADFTFQSTNGIFCNPTTIQFKQQSTGNPIGFIWDFGNNMKGYSGDVSMTYVNAGTYTVTLIAIYDQTTVQVSKTININPALITSIGLDRNYICQPGAIQFSAITTGNIKDYSWDFGDSTGIVNSLVAATPHNYTGFGNYPVSLKVTDSSGCVGQATTSIQVMKPTINASVSPSSGCIPANTSFNATVLVPLNDAVASYSWNFGDGSPVSTTGSGTINKQYNAVGTYDPVLNIVTNQGCTNTYSFPQLAFGTPPFNHVAYPQKPIFCASESPGFVSKAVNANTYIWDFGDGTSAAVSDTIVQHKFTSLGIKTVTVTPYFNGCAGNAISFPIEVIGVIANYNYSNTCADKNIFNFTNSSVGNISALLWSFGDGTATVSSYNATHTYPTSGQFVTNLMVMDSITGCTDNFTQVILTAKPTLLNPDTSICKYTNTGFTVTNNYNTTAATYTWNIVGQVSGPTNSSSININANILGDFNNYVIINNGPQYCLDTIVLNQSIKVKGPNLDFSSTQTACFNSPFIVNNVSKPFFPGDSVLLWYWNFGNSIKNDTIYQPPQFKYSNPGTYNVMLTGIDINGCKDSLSKFTTVAPYPFLRVIPRVDTLCLGQQTILKAFSDNPLVWSPAGSGPCTNCDSIIANPTVTTLYNITSTNSYNCTSTDSVLVKVFAPFSVTTPSNNYYICRNDFVQLDISPKNNRITWSPAAGLSSSTIGSPIASPSQTTAYRVNLTDSAGCFSDSATINVIVKTLPTVDAGPDLTVPYNNTFTINPVYSNNSSKYQWTPSNQLKCDDCPRPVGNAFITTTYTILVTSDSGCIAKDSLVVFVECKDANILMPSAFTPNNDNLNDIFYPITRGIKTINKFMIYNRNGQLIFMAGNFPPNSRSFGWNGYFKGQFQPASAFVYVLEAVCESGATISKKGSFLLLR